MKALSISPRFLAIPTLALAFFMAGCTGSPVGGASWPGITVYPGSAGNVAASADPNSASNPTTGTGAAVSAENQTIYLAYHKVYAVDTDGKMKWEYPAPPATLAAGQAFYAPPAVSKDLIVVTDYVDTVYGLAPDTGAKLWSFTTSKQVLLFKSNAARFVSGAVIGDKYVYTATVDGVVHALNKKDGAEALTFKASDQIWATPLLDGKTLYVASLDRHIYALDADNLTLKWKFPEKPEDVGVPAMGPIVGTPTLHDGVLYFGSFNYNVYALDTATHKIRWQHDTTNWVWSSPIFDEADKLLIGADLDGHIFALHAEDGSPAWKANAAGPVVGAPLLAARPDGTRVVYVSVGAEPNLLTLSAENGKPVIPAASIKAIFDNKILFFSTGTTERVVKMYAPPVAADGLLLLGAHEGDSQIYALNSATLEKSWDFNSTKAEDAAKATATPAPDQGGLFNNPSFLNTLLIVSVLVLLFTLLTGRRQGGKGK